MSFSASQALPFDSARCDNGSRCVHKEVCLRWLSRHHVGARTPFASFFNGKVAQTGKCFDIIPLDPYRPPAFLITPEDWAQAALSQSNDDSLSFEESFRLRSQAKRYLVLATRIKDLELELGKLKERHLASTATLSEPNSGHSDLNTSTDGDPDGHAP